MRRDEGQPPRPEWDAEAVFRAYGSQVLAYACRRLGHVHDAEDAAARVFLKVQEKWDTYDPEKGAVGTWIYAIARNEVRGVLRRRTRGPAVGALSDGALPANPAEEPEVRLLTQETLDQLAGALESLPKRERDILLLRFWSGLSSRETAERMGLSDANVRYLQSSALKKLRRRMTAEN